MENFRGNDDNQPVNPWSNNIDSSLEQADNINPDMPPAPYPEVSSMLSTAELVDKTKESSKKSLRTKAIAVIGGVALVTAGVAVWLGSNNSDDDSNNHGSVATTETNQSDNTTTVEPSPSNEENEPINNEATISDLEPRKGDITAKRILHYFDEDYGDYSDSFKANPQEVCDIITWIVKDSKKDSYVENCYIIGSDNPDNITIQFDTFVEFDNGNDGVYYRTVATPDGKFVLTFTGLHNPEDVFGGHFDTDSDDPNYNLKSHITPIETTFVPSADRAVEIYKSMEDLYNYLHQ